MRFLTHDLGSLANITKALTVTYCGLGVLVFSVGAIVAALS